MYLGHGLTTVRMTSDVPGFVSVGVRHDNGRTFVMVVRFQDTTHEALAEIALATYRRLYP